VPAINYMTQTHVKQPAIVTTDKQGCDQGETAGRTYLDGKLYPLTPFHKKTNNADNPKCNYNSTSRGLSPATAMVSASIALILETNPNLNWRQVKFILAKTAKQIDIDSEDISIELQNGNYIAQNGWITNSEGYKFHNRYGFGKVDIDKAIELTKKIKNNPKDFDMKVWRIKEKSQSVNKKIPKSDKNGLTTSINNGNSMVIEAIKITLSLKYEGATSKDDYYTGDIAIELTSPKGTKHIILSPYSIQSAGKYKEISLVKKIKDLKLISNAFYQEKSSGKWSLKIVNVNKEHTITLENWKITFCGGIETP